MSAGLLENTLFLYADKCPWDKLSSEDWVRLIRKKPQFADKLPNDCKDGNVWLTIVEKRKDLGDQCPWNEIKAEGIYWGRLLKVHPEFEIKCPWSTFNGFEWVGIILCCPQYAERCHWEKLTGDDWAELLVHCPDYGKNCPWDKIKISLPMWLRLLHNRPEFAEKILTRDCKNVNIWFTILKKRNDFDNKCPWKEIKADGYHWAELLSVRPELENRCSWEVFDKDDWVSILNDTPWFATHCLDWNIFDGLDWVKILEHNPQFLNKLPKECTDVTIWFPLLTFVNRKEFDEKCPWDEIKANVSSWAILLKERPDLANRCPWKTFSEEDWEIMLKECPQFAEKRKALQNGEQMHD